MDPLLKGKESYARMGLVCKRKALCNTTIHSSPVALCFKESVGVRAGYLQGGTVIHLDLLGRE